MHRRTWPRIFSALAIVVIAFDLQAREALPDLESPAAKAQLTLTVLTPRNGTVTRDTTLTVSGKVDERADRVTVDDLPAVISVDHSFSVSGVPLDEGVNVIQVVASNRNGDRGVALVTIIHDRTRPLIDASADPDANSAGWHSRDVLVSFACTDAGSGIASCPAPVTVSGDGAGQLVSGVATDRAGNTARASLVLDIDATTPMVAATVEPSANTAGWHRAPATVRFDCDDALSGIATCTEPQIVTRGGAGQAVLGEARDAAGNSAEAVLAISLDLGAPQVDALLTPAANPLGWHRTPVTVEFRCLDSVSGIASCPPPLVVANEGAGLPFRGIAIDRADHRAVAEGTIDLDLTPPGIEVVVTPPANDAGWHDAPPTVSFVCSDALSGLAQCSGPRTVHGEGAGQTIAGAAVDLAGNSAEVSIDLSVDRSPPLIDPARLAPPQCPSTSTDQTPRVEACFTDAVSEVDAASVNLTVDGLDRSTDATVADGCVIWESEIALSAGEHEAVVTVADLAGNVESRAWCFAIEAPEVSVSIEAPASDLATAEDAVDVVGTVGDDVTTVFVNGVEAQRSGTSFQASVALSEGRNVITAIATATHGGTGTASVTAFRDTTAPRIAIETPRTGAVLTSMQVDVAGQVNDLVTGTTINADDCHVEVNGIPATVENRSFLVPNLLLNRGTNILTATATDRVGNSTTASIEVQVVDRAEQRLVLRAGSGQVGTVGTLLERELVVALEDAAGRPVADRPVLFEVVRGGGSLSTADADSQVLTVRTDALGQARVRHRLGRRAGVGNHRVRATAPGFAGEIEFCAGAEAAVAERLLVVNGDQQRGLAGRELLHPLVVIVNDARGNPIAGAEVTFEVARGGGSFDRGDLGHVASVVRHTNLDGLAEVDWTLGSETGVANQRARARLTGAGVGTDGPLVVFTAEAVAGAEGATRVLGVVLDNQDRPVPGATVTLDDHDGAATTDAEGQFVIDDVPVGTLMLHVDASTTVRPGAWTSLSFELETLAGVDNTIGRPVYVLPLDLSNAASVGGSQDLVVPIDQVPGAELRVIAGSATCPDGTTNCEISVTQVRGERVPMAPPLGTVPSLAVTIQPAGTRFDPPARLCLPNDGLAPGEQIELFSFDHDQEDYVAVGTATVASDGSQACSDPGFGVVKAGWHLPAPPPPPCTSVCNEPPAMHGTPVNACQQLEQTSPGGTCGGCVFEWVDVPNGTSCDDGDACSVDDSCESGTCIGTIAEVRDVIVPAVLTLGQDLEIGYTVESDLAGNAFEAVEVRIANSAGTVVYQDLLANPNQGTHTVIWPAGKWNQPPHAGAFANPNNGDYTATVVGRTGSSDCAMAEQTFRVALVLEATIEDRVPTGAPATAISAGLEDFLAALKVVLRRGSTETTFAGAGDIVVTPLAEPGTDGKQIKVEASALNSLADGDYLVLLRDLRDEIGNFADADFDPTNGIQPIQFELSLR